MRRVKTVSAFLMLLTASFDLPAETESQKAEALCKDVGKLCADSAKTEAEKQGFLTMIDSCFANQEPVSYWECRKRSILEGESCYFSQQHCQQTKAK